MYERRIQSARVLSMGLLRFARALVQSARFSSFAHVCYSLRQSAAPMCIWCSQVTVGHFLD